MPEKVLFTRSVDIVPMRKGIYKDPVADVAGFRLLVQQTEKKIPTCEKENCDGCLMSFKCPLFDTATKSRKSDEEVAKACKVKPEDTYILISDSTCVVASIQVSGRMLEQTCHKMFEKGFDAGQIVMIRGTAPTGVGAHSVRPVPSIRNIRWILLGMTTYFSTKTYG